MTRIVEEITIIFLFKRHKCIHAKLLWLQEDTNSKGIIKARHCRVFVVAAPKDSYGAPCDSQTDAVLGHVTESWFYQRIASEQDINHVFVQYSSMLEIAISDLRSIRSTF